MIDRVEERLRLVTDKYAADPRYLAVLRIVYGLWIIAMPVEVMWIKDVPAEFFHPRPGFFFLLPEPPSSAVLTGLMVAQYVLAAALALGIGTLPVSLALSASLIMSSGLCYSFSKLDHMILFEIAPIFLAFAGWGSRWSVDAFLHRRQGTKVRDKGLPVLLYAMAISWGLFTAALPKIKGGWLDPEREATRGYLARELYRGDRVGPLGAWLNEWDVPAFWKALDYSTLVIEAGVVLVVFFPLLFRLWLILIASFHIGVYLTLGISFLDYAMVYAVFFSPFFVWIAQRLRAQRSDERRSDGPRTSPASGRALSREPEASFGGEYGLPAHPDRAIAGDQ